MIAVTQVCRNFRLAGTVSRNIGTSSHRIAKIRGTDISIGRAGHLNIDTTNGGATSIRSTYIKIITARGSIKRCVDTSTVAIARIVCALVFVITTDGCVHTNVVGAGVIGAGITIITILGVGDAESCGRIALVDLAGNVGASNRTFRSGRAKFAFVASLGGVSAALGFNTTV